MGDIIQFGATVDLPFGKKPAVSTDCSTLWAAEWVWRGRGYGPSGGQTVAQSLYWLRYTGCCTVTRSIEVIDILLSLSSVNISRRFFKQYIQ